MLTSCGIKNGKIIDKQFIAEHTEIRCRTQHIGKLLIPINEVVNIEDKYILKIQNKNEQAIIEVNKCEFENWTIGEWYDVNIKK